MNNQFEDYMADWTRVRQDEKPLMICEYRKCGHAYGFIKANAETSLRVQVFDLQLADSSGVKHPAIAVTKKAIHFDKLVKVLANRASHTREGWQLAIGQLLGYSAESCREFSQSYVGLTCGCELCGGPNVAQAYDEVKARAAARQLHDEHVRRTMYHRGTAYDTGVVRRTMGFVPRII